MARNLGAVYVAKVAQYLGRKNGPSYQEWSAANPPIPVKNSAMVRARRNTISVMPPTPRMAYRRTVSDNWRRLRQAVFKHNRAGKGKNVPVLARRFKPYPASKSAGKLRRPRRRKFPKRQRTKGRMQAQGVSFVKETGISISNVTDACYIGHATFCQLQMKLALYRTLLKKLFQKREIVIDNWTTVIPLDNGAIIRIWYKTNADNATALSFADYTNVAGNTFEQAAQSFNSTIGSGGPDFMFDSMVLYPETNVPYTTSINLKYASVHVDVKSSLKLQNTTAATEGQESDAVNNVPLYGRSYYGSGNGTHSNRSGIAEVTLWADEDRGIIYKTGALAAGTSDMPPPSYFKSVTGTGKAKIEPGAIKTSTLVQKQTYALNKFLHHLYKGETIVKDMIHTGKFAFHGFEHMIKATAADPKISIKAEHNYHLMMTIRIKQNWMTDMKIEQDYATF